MFDSIKSGKSSGARVYHKTKRVSRKKSIIFATFLALLFFELGALFGFGSQISVNSGSIKVESRKVSEYESILPFVRVAQARNTDMPLFASDPGGEAKTTENTLGVPILMYHHVADKIDPNDRFGYGLTVSSRNFDTQMKYLVDNRITTISFDEMYAAMYQGKALPERSVILTFDDGYRDNYDIAFPILKKYGKKGTFFVISDYIEGGGNYLTRDQIKEMAKSGMSIESHAKTHPEMATLDVPKITLELIGSKKSLEEITGRRVNYFAYPYGSHNPVVERILKSSGYIYAVTTKNGKVESPKESYLLPRLRVGPTTSIKLFAELVN